MDHYIDFYKFLQISNQSIFIEVEGRSESIDKFVRYYSQNYDVINNSSEGICILNSNVDKWGVEYRIYFNGIERIPQYWDDRKYRNSKYRASKYHYRIDDKKLVEYLFDNGYRIGYN